MMKELKPMAEHMERKYPHAGGAATFLEVANSDLSWDEKLVRLHQHYNVTLNAAAKWLMRYKKEGSRV